MRVEDFEEMAEAMAESLMHSDALAARGPNSPTWVVSMDKVLNLSSDVMTDAEQWTIMARLRSSTAMQALWDQKNVRFVLPPERAAHLREVEAPRYTDTEPQRRTPTHTLAATFRSVTRGGAEGRVDDYYCEFQMLDLRTAEPVWIDEFRVKRIAQGHVWD